MRAEFRVNLDAPELCAICVGARGGWDSSKKRCRHKPIDTMKILKNLKTSLVKQFGAEQVQQTNDGTYVVLTVE